MKLASFALLSAILLRPASAVEPMPAFAPGSRILFQGDSITDGNRGRSADPNHILGHGYQFIVAARWGAELAERGLTFLNRGISGNTVLDLEKRWEKDTLELHPDLLSILIGVNDNSKGVAHELYEETYDRLLTAARAANPQLKLVLCEPFALRVGKKAEVWDEWYPGIVQRQQIVARLAAKHGAALVHFQAVFDAATKRAPADYWIWDGVHPTYSGHQLMAEEWTRVVAEHWHAP
ncbi:MAG: SGNH/GDSL hydrolase family protein [Chthoniobacteraceae bacterium]